MLKLVITADDFGSSKSINNGIKQAIRAKKIDQVSVMVNRPEFYDAVHFLHSHPISIGLHFNLTEVNASPQLVSVCFQIITGKLTPTKVALELDRQYQLLTKTGLVVTHLDSHQHLHLWPSLFPIFDQFAKQHHMKLRSCPMSFCQFVHQFSINFKFKVMVINFLLMVNYYLYRPVYDYQTIFDLNWHAPISREVVSKYVSSLPNGVSEMFCHLSGQVWEDSYTPSRYECLKFILHKLPVIRERVYVSHK